MKKTLSIVLILVLMLSIFGCKSKPMADNEEVYVESVGGESENETEPEAEQPADPEQSEEQTEPEQQPDVQQPEQQTDKMQHSEQIETELDKAPPCQVTIEDNFADDKILVLLTREESRKQKQYTAEDFPELDIEKISILIKYKPEKDNRLGLSITLKSNDKQKVIDGIRILEEYEIVYCAEPNGYDIAPYNDVSDNMTVEQMGNNNSVIPLTPRYTSTDAMSEYYANLSTLACCAKKYTTALPSEVRGKICISNGPNLYGYFTKWNPLS